jgi:hypothetical protein
MTGGPIQVTSAAPSAVPRKHWGIRVALGVAAAALIYVVLTFTWPSSIPRLSFLPKPEASGGGYDGCNWYGDDWERAGLVWVPVRYSTLRGCDLD